MWFSGKNGGGKRVYVEAESKEDALTKGCLTSSWGPFPSLSEATAAERFCHFENGVWQDRPSRDKVYKKKYISLDDYVGRDNVIVIRGATDGTAHSGGPAVGDAAGVGARNQDG